MSMWHNVAAPFGGILDLVPRSAFHVPHIVSMRPIVAAPLRGVLGLVVLHLVARFAVHVPYLVAVDNSPPFGGYYI